MNCFKTFMNRKWDDELAKVAQAYANKCLFTHNKGRPKGTGENLAWKRNSKKKRGDLKYMTHLWYEEINLYDPAGPLNITETGHFTQMIWADTKFVGCGVSFYEDGKHPNSPYQTLLVCNYKPPGNYPTPPYEKYDGTRCSRGVQSTVFPHLCAHDQEHADGKYVPCSGIKLQSTSILLFFFLLCRYYHHNLYL
ncbi:unnamed protein product [Nezara viridula]|uniref:SCP domain-containing protein n=1 Tax=Nezara viridula TaxID=85310 RepID=A0A9P0MX01_NEZVI|nr:unnamed protein product [Nezara viridula]